MIQHGVRQPHAAHPADAGSDGVGGVLAAPPSVVGDVKGLAAVLALRSLRPVFLPPLASVGGRRGAGEEGAGLGGDNRGDALVVQAALALTDQRCEGGVRVRGRRGRRQRVAIVMLGSVRLAEFDVGAGVVHLDEFVTHVGVAVVLVARQPGPIGLPPLLPLGGPLPAALPRVDPHDFLIFLEGDMTGKPGQRLRSKRTEARARHKAGSTATAKRTHAVSLDSDRRCSFNVPRQHSSGMQVLSLNANQKLVFCVKGGSNKVTFMCAQPEADSVAASVATVTWQK